MVVRPSTQEEVEVCLTNVHREGGQVIQVVFDIRGYNARFIFEPGDRGVQLTSDGRQKILPTLSQATLHVPRSVFRAMKQWACSIISDVRQEESESCPNGQPIQMSLF